LAVAFAPAVLGAPACLGPDQNVFWVCHNPVTGKDDGSIYDSSHVVNGVADPCHCYDPCGPQKTCPIEVDAGPPAPGCNTSDGGDAGNGG
jgi:hypothetical protein